MSGVTHGERLILQNKAYGKDRLDNGETDWGDGWTELERLPSRGTDLEIYLLKSKSSGDYMFVTRGTDGDPIRGMDVTANPDSFRDLSRELSRLKPLSDLYLEKSSGYLDVRSDMEMGIFFFNGIVKYVDCDDPNLLIGKLLVSNEIITKEQQREIIDFSNKKGIQIGEALIEQGWLTPHELSRILEFQMKLKLLNGFRFKSGDYSFTETDKITPNSDIIFNINPLQVIGLHMLAQCVNFPFNFRQRKIIILRNRFFNS